MRGKEQQNKRDDEKEKCRRVLSLTPSLRYICKPAHSLIL